jgi:hypothetical protein
MSLKAPLLLAVVAGLVLPALGPARAHAAYANGIDVQVKCVEDLSASDMSFGTWRARFVAINTTTTDMTLTGDSNIVTVFPTVDNAGAPVSAGSPPTVFPARTEVEWVTDPLPKRNNRATLPGSVTWALATAASSGVRADYRGSPRCYQAPQVISPVTVVGTPVPGQVLTAAGEQVKVAQGNYTVSVSWLRDCDDFGSVDYVSGRSYVVRPQDVGHRIQAQLSYSDSTSGGVFTQSPCDDRALIRATPAAATVPHVSGPAVLGSVLAIAGGAWTGDGPLTETVAWESCDTTACTPVGTAPTYAPVPADIGRTIRARVTQTSGWGAGTVTTASTAPVAAGATSVGGRDGGLPLATPVPDPDPDPKPPADPAPPPTPTTQKSTSPTPMTGCVSTRDDIVVGLKQMGFRGRPRVTIWRNGDRIASDVELSAGMAKVDASKLKRGKYRLVIAGQDADGDPLKVERTVRVCG